MKNFSRKSPLPISSGKPAKAVSLLALAFSFFIFTAQVHAEKVPRLKGKPDFSGIWQTTSAADFDLEPHSARIDAPPGPGVVEGGEIPYKPEALAKRKENFENRFKSDPRLKGWTLGVPRNLLP